MLLVDYGLPDRLLNLLDNLLAARGGVIDLGKKKREGCIFDIDPSIKAVA